MRPRNAILLAAAIVFVVGAWVPFGSTLLYPLTLFTTWVHEMGHGLTAIVCGGTFHRLEIFANASGLAQSSVADGIPRGLVALGGLLAPPILGAAILALVHGPRRARVLLTGLAVAIVISLILFVRSATGLIAMPLVAIALAWSAWWGFAETPQRRVIVAQALGVLLALDTLTRMVSYVFKGTVTVDGKSRGSDITTVAEHLGGHYLLGDDGHGVCARAAGARLLVGVATSGADERSSHRIVHRRARRLLPAHLEITIGAGTEAHPTDAARDLTRA